MQGIRWITFDAVGTLIDPRPSVGHVYAAVMARHGIVAEAAALQTSFVEVFRRLTRIPRDCVDENSEYAFWKALVLEVIAHWVRGEDAERVFEDAYTAFADPANWYAINGGPRLLESLHKRGYRLALLSNADARIRGIIEAHGLGIHMEQMLLSSELGHEKPDIRLFRKVEEQLGATPEEILHIGDSERNDGQGPRAAGWHAIVIDRRADDLFLLAEAIP